MANSTCLQQFSTAADPGAVGEYIVGTNIASQPSSTAWAPPITIFDASSSVYHTNPKANQTMVPGTQENHLSHTHFHSNHHLPPDPFPSGGTNDSPARQFTSSVAFPVQNRHSLPSLPPPSLMLTLLPEILPRRNKKLRKPNTTRTPPNLPPLSFVEDHEFDIDFEQIFRDVQSPSLTALRPQSLTHTPTFQRDTYPLDYATPFQPPSHGAEMMGRHWNPFITQLASSSGTAATGDSAALIAPLSQISSSFTLCVPFRSRSVNGHSVSASITMKGSNLMRKLSRRSPRLSLDASSSQNMIVDSKLSGATNGSTSSGSPRRWSWRRSTAEHNGKDESSAKTSFLDSKSSHSKQDEVKKACNAQSPSAKKVSRPPSITISENTDMSIPATFDPQYSRSRPKFTLEVNDSEVDLLSQSGTTPAHYANASQSCPPSRRHSIYSPFSSSLCQEQQHQPPRRRWTFASAMMDIEVTDEALVEVLAGIRSKRNLTGSEDNADEVWDADLILFGSQDEVPQLDHHTRSSTTSVDLSFASSLPSFPVQDHNSVPTVGSRPLQHWQTAQKVLFTCRELVRTERHYLASLHTLLASNTETVPPPLMLKYAEDLARVSELYLGQMEENPSACGVAAAILGSEKAIEGAFVRWCGSVGMWFKNGGYDHSMRGRRLSKVIKLGGGSSDEMYEYDEATSGPLKKVNSWRRSMSSISDLSTSISTARKKDKNAPPPPSISNGYERQRRLSQAKKPPVRDLAILPTQRIMRYVLLYRDLLDHTPSTSPAHPLMKRAADATLRLAQKCDRAQDNSAFIPSNSAVLTTNPSSSSGNWTSDFVQPLNFFTVC